MRPFLLFSLLVLGLGAGCEESPSSRGKRVEEARRRVPPDYRVVTIEGCEYLRVEVTHGYATLTHKGNCRNPIHPYQDTSGRRAARPAR
ncbi:hypothetical protein [uncultured Hymenobacter sp.]|uniref:hypothetical protein n=1 Tax=uncultured Hymenobacter sp. TaxID=170016 RepID=UPI0035CBD8C8